VDQQPKSVIILIDYQNIHLTGHQEFALEGQAKHETLVHPLSFAHQVMAARRVIQGERHLPGKLQSVVAFRGLPSNRHEPNFYRRSLAQRAEWTRDPRVEVIYRPLRYPQEWPTLPAQEKGIDVLIALALVRSADRHRADVLILASHDTDLEPAIEAAEEVEDVDIETVGWKGCKRLRGGSSDRWHTFLNSESFIRCRDRKDYH
jgi:uncharacterized LabA/DUF88 family protein